MAADLEVSIGVDVDGLNQGLNSVSQKFEELGKKLTGLGAKMSLAITTPLTLISRQMIKLSSDTEESLNKVNVAFGKSAEQVKSFAETSLTNFGIARGSALDMAAGFGDMATSMGLTQDQAANMSVSLVSLGADLASFKNIGIEQAKTALTGIFTGETESLKTLGIVMTEANLQAYALTQGFKGNFDSLSQGEKVLLRYNYVLANTKNAQGDFKRTGEGAANQMRIFQESLKEVGATFGDIVLPFFTKVVSVLNSMLNGFKRLNDVTKTVILVIAGLAATVGPILLLLGSFFSVTASITTAMPILAMSIKMVTASLGPYIAALTILGGIIYSDIQANKEFAKTTQDVNKTREQAKASVRGEISTMERYISVLEDANSSVRQQKKAKDELIKMNPEFSEVLKGDKTNFGELNRVAGNTVTQLIRVATAKKLVAQQQAAIDALEELRSGGGLTFGDKFQILIARLTSNSINTVGVGIDKMQEIVFNKGVPLINTVKKIEKTLAEDYGDLLETLNGEKLGGGGGGAEKGVKTIENEGNKRLEAFKKMHKEEVDLRWQQLWDRLKNEREIADAFEDELKTIPPPAPEALSTSPENLAKYIGLDNLVVPVTLNFAITEKSKENLSKFTGKLGDFINKNLIQLKNITESLIGDLSNILAEGLSGIFKQDVKFDPRKMISQVLQAIGTMIIGIATPLVAALALGTAATFGGMTFQWASALGMLGAGIAMKGGGMALGSSSSGSTSVSTSTGARNIVPYSNPQSFNTGNVKFEIQGNTLVGVLNNVNRANG